MSRNILSKKYLSIIDYQEKNDNENTKNIIKMINKKIHLEFLFSPSKNQKGDFNSQRLNRRLHHQVILHNKQINKKIGKHIPHFFQLATNWNKIIHQLKVENVSLILKTNNILKTIISLIRIMILT